VLIKTDIKGGDFLEWAGIFTGVGAVDLMGILTEVKSLVPIVLPAVVGFLAFRKGWGFLRSAIMGA